MYKKAFTLVEVMLVILIIGVVAILVLPMIKEKIDTKEYEIANKKMTYIFQQAVAAISTDNLREASSAEDFVENYLKKHITMIKTCKNENLRECGIETKENGIFTYEETKMTMPKEYTQLNPLNTGETDKSYGFIMNNGYSVNLFYRPHCTTWDKAYLNSNAKASVCINVVYDMNGLKGPNQVGKDIGTVTVIDPIHPTVTNLNIYSVAEDAYRNPNCNGARLPTYTEATAYIFNSALYSPDIANRCAAKSATITNSDGLPLIILCNGNIKFLNSHTNICLKNK